MRISDIDIHRGGRVANRAAHGTPHWVETLARAGYAAKGVVYGLIGVLALMAAFGEGGQVGGGQQAIQTIGSQPFGQFLLVVTGIGLAGYSIWRFVQAALDPEHAGTDAKGVAKRLGYTGSGLIYGALAILALQMGIGSGGGGGGSQQTYVAKVLSEPFGQLIVGAIGVFVIGAGIYQLYKAYTAKFVRDLKTNEMSATERTWAERLGRLGYAARGVVLPIIGYFVLKAAITYQPGQAKGVGGALATLASQPFGTFLLIVVAAGLVAYGAFQLVQAKYRRIPSQR